MWRRVSGESCQKIAPDARELTDAISARPPPGLLVEASLPGAAALGGLADVVVDALADGAGFTMHGIASASRYAIRRSHAATAQARSIVFEEPGLPARVVRGLPGQRLVAGRRGPVTGFTGQ